MKGLTAQLFSHRTKTMTVYRQNEFNIGSKLQIGKWKITQNNIDKKQSINASV